jgi:hypothetical protein
VFGNRLARLLVLLCLVWLAACLPRGTSVTDGKPGGLPTGAVTPAPAQPADTAPSPGAPSPIPGVTGTPGRLPGRVYVESARLIPPQRPQEAWHLQVEASLANGCTSLDGVTQRWEGEVLMVELQASSAAGVMCTEALVAVSEDVALATAGVPAGEYAVRIADLELSLPLGAAPAGTDPETPTLSLGECPRDLLIQPAAVELVAVEPPERGGMVNVVVSGYYPDGCTRYRGFSQTIQGRRILVTLSTSRPRDAMCTMAIVPYTVEIQLSTEGLAAGPLAIEINGVEAETTLP